MNYSVYISGIWLHGMHDPHLCINANKEYYYYYYFQNVDKVLHKKFHKKKKKEKEKKKFYIEIILIQKIKFLSGVA